MNTSFPFQVCNHFYGTVKGEYPCKQCTQLPGWKEYKNSKEKSLLTFHQIINQIISSDFKLQATFFFHFNQWMKMAF